MSNKLQFGGLFGAKVVAAGATYTAPADTYIYAIIPSPSFTGKAPAVEGALSLSTDGTSGGSDVTVAEEIYGKYTSLTVTSGQALAYCCLNRDNE